MNLATCVELWETIHAGSKFFDEMSVNADINKTQLFRYIMNEFDEMETIDGNSDVFHERVKTFFKIHKWNIDKLVETTLYEYDPINNYSWEQDRKLERDVGTKNTSNKTTKENNSATTNKITENEKTGTDQENKNWTETGNSDGSDINLVSAFNDLPATLNNLSDSERDRTVSHNNYEKGGNDSVTGSNSENQNGSEEVVGVETKNGSDDKVDVGSVDEDVTEKIKRTGISGKTYQELIEEQRQTAEFNIYKWIGRHFCKELLIAVW